MRVSADVAPPGAAETFSAPVDIARAVRFLIENQSATGTTVIVDVGSHFAPAARDFAFQGTPR